MFLEGETPSTMAKTTGIAIMELTTFRSLTPDIVVTIADRFETIATSIAASYQNIPLVHIQGGEITGNMMKSKTRQYKVEYSFGASEDAKQRVIKMGEESHSVINTGCPSMDIARSFGKSRDLIDPLVKYEGVGDEIHWRNGYLIVLQHPVTTGICKC